MTRFIICNFNDFSRSVLTIAQIKLTRTENPMICCLSPDLQLHCVSHSLIFFNMAYQFAASLWSRNGWLD